MVHFIPHFFRCRPCDGRHWQCRHWSHGLGPRPRGHRLVGWQKWFEGPENMFSFMNMSKNTKIHSYSVSYSCIYLCTLGTAKTTFVFKSGMFHELCCEIAPTWKHLAVICCVWNCSRPMNVQSLSLYLGQWWPIDPFVHPYILSYLSDSYLSCMLVYLLFFDLFVYLRLGLRLYVVNHLEMMCVYMYVILYIYIHTCHSIIISTYSNIYIHVHNRWTCTRSWRFEVERARDLRMLGWGCQIF